MLSSDKGIVQVDGTKLELASDLAFLFLSLLKRETLPCSLMHRMIDFAEANAGKQDSEINTEILAFMIATEVFKAERKKTERKPDYGLFEKIMDSIGGNADGE